MKDTIDYIINLPRELSEIKFSGNVYGDAYTFAFCLDKTIYPDKDIDAGGYTSNRRKSENKL